MKRPILRLSMFVAAATLVSAPLVAARAEGHRPFYSRLNPKTWFQKSAPDGKSKSIDEPKTAKGTANSSIRKYLNEDPFSSPIVDSDNDSKVTQKTPEIVAGSSRPNTSVPQIAPKLGGQSTPRSGNEEEFVPFERPVAATKAEQPAPTTRPQRPSKPSLPKSESPFEDGFDQNVAKILNEVKEETPLPKPTEAPASNSRPGYAKVRQAPVADEPIDAPPVYERIKVQEDKLRSDFEQFLAEREQATAKHVPEVANHPIPAREQLDRRVRAFVKDEAVQAEPQVDIDEPASVNKVIAESRQRLESSSILKNQLVDDVDDTAPGKSRLTQTSGTESRRLERPVAATSNPQKRVTQKPEAKSSASSSDEMPLIVPNEMVPERRMYVSNKTYPTENTRARSEVSSESRSPMHSTNEASKPSTLSSLELPAASLAPRPSSNHTLPDVAPRASANQAPALTITDNTKVKQLSFSEEQQSGLESRLPLLSIGATPAPPKESTDNGLPLFPTAGTEANADRSGAPNTLRTAVIKDFPDASDDVAPPKKRNSLATLGVIAATLLGIGLVLRKKAAVVTTVSNGVGDSPEKQS